VMPLVLIKQLPGRIHGVSSRFFLDGRKRLSNAYSGAVAIGDRL